MSEAQWKQFVQLFAEKNPQLTKQQVLQHAKKPFLQLKKYFSQRGGEIREPPYIIKIDGLEYTDVNQIPGTVYINVKKSTPEQIERAYEESNLNLDFYRQHPYLDQFHVSITLREEEKVPYLFDYMMSRLPEKIHMEPKDSLHIRNEAHIELLVQDEQFFNLFAEYLCAWKVYHVYNDINNRIIDSSRPKDIRNEWGVLDGQPVLLQRNKDEYQRRYDDMEAAWKKLDERAGRIIHGRPVTREGFHEICKYCPK